MTSSLSNIGGESVKNICGYVGATLCGAAYVTSLVFAHTASKSATVFVKECIRNKAATAITPFGNMTCTDLASLVRAESVLVPMFAWTLPVVGLAATIFIARNIASGGCCRRRGYEPIQSNQLPVEREFKPSSQNDDF